MTKSILVTGASTGLGLEASVYLAERGFEVYASMRDLEGRGELDEEAGRRGVQLNVLQLDITNRDEIEDAVQSIIKRSGHIYGLVNNAGIGLRGYFEDQAEEEIREVFEANVFGTMAVTRAVLPHMRAAGQGRIVIITSVGGRISSLAVSSYCSTKFAQEGFGESLSQELRPLGIDVVLVEPAIIKTTRWSVNRGVAKGALNEASPYYRWFQESERLTDRLVRSSPTQPADYAKVLHKALTARRPRLRYVAGKRAGLVMALRRYIPGELFERLYFGAAVRHITRASERNTAPDK